jgi:UDP-N-acetylglucosamine 2-epimerase (non-hydrolysing)
MSGVFMRELGLPAPAFRIDGVGGSDRATQISTMVAALAPILRDQQPGALIVQGDTNTVVAGALAASISQIPIVHVEAGLRSHDRSMPEEINRRVTSILADVHCAPTELSRDNLLSESVPPAAVHVTGNTVVEACERTLARIPSTPHPDFSDGPYILATIHRPENTDDAAALGRILVSLAHAEIPVVLAAHPRVLAAAERFDLFPLLNGLRVVPPLGYEQFLRVARGAALLVSDSGGLQEETTVLRKPMLLVRRNTERPEASDAGFVRMVRPTDSLDAAIGTAIRDEEWGRCLQDTPSPFGDGYASRRIAALAKRLAITR